MSLTTWEDEQIAQQESLQRSEHYTAVYINLKANIELKRVILAREQAVAELGFETPAAGDADALDSDNDDENLHQQQQHDVGSIKSLPEKLEDEFKVCATLHQKVLTDLRFPPRLTFPFDESAGNSSNSSSSSQQQDQQQQSNAKQQAESVFRDARHEIESLEKRIVEAAGKKHQFDADETQRAALGQELESLVAERFVRVTTMISDVTACFASSLGA